MKKKATAFFLFCLLCLLIGIGVGSRRFDPNFTIPTKDTIYVYDTVFIDKPIVVDSIVLRYDTIVVTKTRQEVIHDTDTIYVEIPITQKHYSDSLYDAWVSGYRSNLDSISIRCKETIITNKVVEYKYKTKRWGFGVSGGCTYDGNLKPYIGIGINYNIVSW